MLSFSKYSLSLLILISSFFISSFAQEQDYKWGIGLQMNTVDKPPPLFIFSDFFVNDLGFEKNYSFSAGFTFNHQLKNNLLFRCNIAGTHYSITTGTAIFFPPNNTNFYYDSTLIRELSINVTPGIYWMKESEKFSLYSGFEMLVNIHDVYHFHSYSYNTFTNVAIRDGEIPGGFGTGIGSFIGVNILPFKKKRIELSGELSTAVLYTKVGGEFSWESKQVDTITDTILFTVSQPAVCKFDGFSFYPFKGEIIIKYKF